MTGGGPVLPRRLRTDELLYASAAHRNTPMQIALLGEFEAAPFLAADGRVDVARVRAQLALRSWRVPEFRQRVLHTRPGEGRPLWVADPAFDPDHHVRSASLPPGADLVDWAANRAARPLDPDRPLWRCEVIDGLPGGRFALLIVVSHVLADGLAGILLAGALLDPGPAVDPPARPVIAPSSLPTHRELVLLRLRELAATLSRIGSGPRPARARPRLRLRDLREAMAGFAGPEPGTPLPRRIGPGRRMVVVRRSLDELERTGHALGGTVNDLLLAAVTTGLRDLLSAHGPVPRDVVLRGNVPVATRGSDHQVMAMLLVGLPVGEPDPRHRLAELHRTTTAGKARLRASGGDAIDLPLPRPLLDWVLLASRRFGSRRLTLSVTDVPGPGASLWLAGARLLSTVPIAPMSRQVPLSVAALSYAGELAVSINADAGATGLDVVADGVARGFTELIDLARAATAPRRAG